MSHKRGRVFLKILDSTIRKIANPIKSCNDVGSKLMRHVYKNFS
jgi:hypothetical protein